MWIAIAALVLAALSFLISLLLVVRARTAGGAASRRKSAELNPNDAERVTQLASELSALFRRVDAIELHGQRAVQRVGVVRFNPFVDTGSNQSFVLAFLDARGDGFVLSSLQSRQQSRVYLKAVAGGRAESAVSEEEVEAIRRAMTGSSAT
ncbi:MAG: DUF4446 family protein [Candidatus Limnocylindrales bacterium]